MFQPRQWAYRQATQLLEELSAVAPQCPARILCGDLNVTPDSQVVRALERAGLEEAYAGQRPANTCNSNRKEKTIDYLFHTRALEARPVALPVIDDQTPLPSDQEPSDHLPVMASFDWIGS
jgi:endonuclease/exonuclease/phosphatase family metal-dependent hydrolase